MKKNVFKCVGEWGNPNVRSQKACQKAEPDRPCVASEF